MSKQQVDLRNSYIELLQMKNKVIGIYYKLRKGSRLNTFEVSELEDRFEQLAALRDRAMGNREMKRRGG